MDVRDVMLTIIPPLHDGLSRRHAIATHPHMRDGVLYRSEELRQYTEGASNGSWLPSRSCEVKRHKSPIPDRWQLCYARYI